MNAIAVADPTRYVECSGIRISVKPSLIKVEAIAQHPIGKFYKVQIDHQGMRQCESIWDPNGPGFEIYPPVGSRLDLTHCDVRVKETEDALSLDQFTICYFRGGYGFTRVENGRMPCVACSDSKHTRPGLMWVGKNQRTGIDEWITCPECRGEGFVPRFRHLDPFTGLDIDYEQQDRSLLLVDR
jgi:hypothetical protein